MKKVWVHKTDSFRKAKEFDDRYNLSLSPEERLSDVQFLREEYLKMNPAPQRGARVNPAPQGGARVKKGLRNESRKGLRRVLKVVKQKQS